MNMKFIVTAHFNERNIIHRCDTLSETKAQFERSLPMALRCGGHCSITHVESGLDVQYFQLNLKAMKRLLEANRANV